MTWTRRSGLRPRPSLARPASSPDWFAWTGDRSYEAAVVATGRVLVVGVPQYLGLGAALLGLVTLAAAGGYELARRRLLT
jgi:hypothetical protein